MERSYFRSWLFYLIAIWPLAAIAGDSDLPLVADGESVPVHYVNLHDRSQPADVLPEGIPSASGPRFILIHGFRTPESAGRRLAEHVAVQIHSTMPMDGRDELWALLWNSGAEDSVNFTGAARRADQLASPVALLLEKIIVASNGEPVVVIAHSLGARVALSALNELSLPGQVDLLALIQAAVPAASIYDWEGTDVYNNLFDENHPDPRRRIPWDTPMTPCEFAPALDRAAHVLITQSGKDRTLGTYFEIGRQLTAEDCWPIENDPALGRPFQLPPPRRVVFPGTPLPWGDLTRPSVRLFLGLDPFDIPEIDRAVPELREPDAIIDYNFVLSHASTEFIDLEDVVEVSPNDWHSPLYGPSGRSILAVIRERLNSAEQ